METASGDRTVLFNYACHPVCYTSEITELSADWSGTVYQRVSDELDDPTVML